MARRHEIPATPENMVWGYLDSASAPVLSVNSGDTVTLHSFPAGGKETLPDDLRLVPDDYMRALETLPNGPGPHFITGPVYVKGAQVGDALQIDILDVKIRQDWGFVSILPLLGTLPDEFTDYETIHPAIDRERNVCIMPWGTEIPLDPFFGIVATAPPPSWGRCGSPVPRAFGGNMDNKELRAGTTLYLPVFNEGALFFAGTDTPFRATAKYASPRWKQALPARFASPCERIWN
jgi:acetamidase/formamidase